MMGIGEKSIDFNNSKKSIDFYLHIRFIVFSNVRLYKSKRKIIRCEMNEKIYLDTILYGEQ